MENLSYRDCHFYIMDLGMCLFRKEKNGGNVGVFLAAAALVAIYISFGAGFRSDRIEVWRKCRGNREKDIRFYRDYTPLLPAVYLEPDLVKVCRNSDLFRNRINDMIFSIICEELGMIGAGIVIIMFVIMMWRILNSA